MVETLYPSEMARMTQFSEHDWIPHSTTSLSSLENYCLDTSFLSPPTSSLLSQASPMISARSPYIRPNNPYNTVEDLSYPSNALRIKQEGLDDLAFSENHSSQIHRSPTPYYGSFGVSEVNTSTKRKRSLVPIAPNPTGLNQINALKRSREDSGPVNIMPKRRRSANPTTVNTGAVELTEEERLLIRYKDEGNLPWKEIALKFQVEAGRTFQVPALQMRYKRLREKLRVWSDADIEALEKAREYWERQRWEIIATKMHTDFGVSEKWPAKSCQRKWAELHPGLDVIPKEYDAISSNEFREREKTSWSRDEDDHESVDFGGSNA